jgi:hypothetical protein
MFQSCKWAIIRLSIELMKSDYTIGGVGGDEISSYIIMRGVSIGCRHIHGCVVHHVGHLSFRPIILIMLVSIS